VKTPVLPSKYKAVSYTILVCILISDQLFFAGVLVLCGYSLEGSFPKQFAALINGQSLMTLTVDRIKSLGCQKGGWIWGYRIEW